MDKTARAIAAGELGYLSSNTQSNKYCECRWPKWELWKCGEKDEYCLYCRACFKYASPLVLELIDDCSVGPFEIALETIHSVAQAIRNNRVIHRDAESLETAARLIEERS